MLRSSDGRLTGLAALAVGAVLLGCDTDRTLIPSQERLEHLRATAETITQRQSEGFGRMEKTWQRYMAARQNEVRATHENVRALRKWSEDQFRRWHEREPTYRRMIEDRFKGDVEHMTLTAEKMFH